VVSKHYEAGVKRAVIKLLKIRVSHRDIMKQLEMFKATLSRILAIAKANPSYLAPSLCAIIADDMPSDFVLCKARQRSQEDKVDFLQLVCIYMYVIKYDH
jgi:hypothetical protein